MYFYFRLTLQKWLGNTDNVVHSFFWRWDKKWNYILKFYFLYPAQGMIECVQDFNFIWAFTFKYNFECSKKIFHGTASTSYVLLFSNSWTEERLGETNRPMLRGREVIDLSSCPNIGLSSPIHGSKTFVKELLVLHSP